MNMNIREKLLQVQSKLRAPKSQSNDFGHYKYRSCEDILEALKPLLMEAKTLLILSDEVQFIENRFYVIATATFSDTEPESETITVTSWARENDIQKGMNEAQITGIGASLNLKLTPAALTVGEMNTMVTQEALLLVVRLSTISWTPKPWAVILAFSAWSVAPSGRLPTTSNIVFEAGD
jgi:hypothetical protein